MKRYKLLTFLFILCLLLCGCSSSALDSNKAESSITGGFRGDYDISDGMTDTIPESPTLDKNNGGNQESDVLFEEKLIYSCDMNIQTLEYEKTIIEIKKRVTEFNGIIESEKEYDNNYSWYYSDEDNGTMSSSIKIRIPSNKYYEFLKSIEGQGKVISKSSNVENISKQYYEVSSLIESLEIQEDRLLEMMADCKTIPDMISVEARLTEVQSQLNSYKTQLAFMDNKVTYSTITLVVDEVIKYSPKVVEETFFDRLKETLKETWEFFWDMLEGLLFFVIRLLPVLIIICPVVILIAYKIKKRKKSKANDKQQNIN